MFHVYSAVTGEAIAVVDQTILAHGSVKELKQYLARAARDSAVPTTFVAEKLGLSSRGRVAKRFGRGSACSRAVSVSRCRARKRAYAGL